MGRAVFVSPAAVRYDVTMTDEGDGLEYDGDTIVDEGETEPALIDPDRPATIDGGFVRYQTRELLGAGGMGEVRRCTDETIGRDVAIKIIRDVGGDAADEIRRRFEREARIQGQLEHPSIVPVYDLGTRPDGVAYFTMKRVRGRTLEEIITRLRDGDPAIESEFPRRRLLNAFATACLAVAYANSRGVIHRDLKPANIILGDFGEVYVLDWGIAKVSGNAATSFFSSGASSPEQATQVGELLGTPGYMAPEQVRGDAGIDVRADVYSLAMILFELLALERFHSGKTVDALLISALETEAARPAARAPDRDIPLELDELCARASQPGLEDRLASARDLHDLLERYLAGERDAQQRRALAERHVNVAEAALAAGQVDPELDIENRSKAIRELIAAFALEPKNRAARQAMVRALTGTADDLPQRAKAELREHRSRQRSRAARNATIGLFSLYALIPLVLWNGVRDYSLLALTIGMLTASMAVAFALSRASSFPSSYYALLMLVLAAFAATTATLFGPFFVTPSLALGCVAALIAGARMRMLWRALVIAIAVTAVLIPATIQWLGPSWSYAVGDGSLRILPLAIELNHRTLFVLLVMAVAAITAPAMLVGRSVDVLHRAEERLFAQAWRLRRIFPAEVDEHLAQRAS